MELSNDKYDNSTAIAISWHITLNLTGKIQISNGLIPLIPNHNISFLPFMPSHTYDNALKSFYGKGTTP